MSESAPVRAAPAKICIFGTYTESPQHTRASELRRALSAGSFVVQECHVPLREAGSRHRHFRNFVTVLWRALCVLGAWTKLVCSFFELPRADLLLVPYPAHVDVVLARMLAWRSQPPIVMDAFLGLYETVVTDRALVSADGLAARMLKRFEHCSLRCADRILVDTPALAASLGDAYRIPANRFVVVPLGIDETIWHPGTRERVDASFQVLFWGTFIPLHGVTTIIDCARILDAMHLPVRIKLIGWGQTAEAIAGNLASHPVRCLEWQRDIVSPAAIAREARASDCVLGIFGTTDKALRVVPYKVYQAMASARPVITADTPAVRALLRDGLDALLVPPGNAEALALAIARLHADRELCARLGEQARSTFEQRLSGRFVSESVQACIRALLPRAVDP